MGGKIAVFASGKGGVGKSTLSALLGITLAGMGHSVLAIELDAGLRSLDIMLGVEDKVVYDLADVLNGDCELKNAVVKSDLNPRFSLLCAPHESRALAKGEALEKLLEEAAEHYNDILVDLPSGIYDYFDSVFSKAEAFFVVVTPDIVSVRDGAVISHFADLYRQMKPYLIINKVPKDPQALVSFTDLDEVIDRVGLQLFGVVMEDRQIPFLTSEGKAPALGSYAERVFRAMAGRYLGNYVALTDY
ncbi:MAG: septum site-determining protein MinD [Oscillospiraceae bacterium]|jgi:septum site-determining protein MinD|nr:septum site-determining protein MinD [Oscillospiraceae bacterium]